jgi:hypothetical protein
VIRILNYMTRDKKNGWHQCLRGFIMSWHDYVMSGYNKVSDFFIL